MSTITHIAGLRIEIGSVVRQRCSWCGATLIDVSRVAFQADDPSKDASTWPVGALVGLGQQRSPSTRR